MIPANRAAEPGDFILHLDVLAIRAAVHLVDISSANRAARSTEIGL